MSSYNTIQQHQPLRVPIGWDSQERRLIAQLEETFDDIYRRFGRLRWDDLGKALQQRFVSADGKVSQLEQTAEEFRVQLGQLGTPEELINAILRITHEGIYMQGGEVSMQTDTFAVTSLTDGEEMMHLDKQGLDAPLVSARVIRSPSVLSVWTGGTVLPFAGGVNASLANLARYLTTDVRLTVPAGTYSEDVTIAGLSGSGSLIIMLEEGAVIQGRVSIVNCSCPVGLTGGAILAPYDDAVYVSACTDVSILSCAMQYAETPSTAVSGIRCFASSILAEGCTFERLGNCVTACQGSRVTAINNKGGTANSLYTPTANVGYAFDVRAGAWVSVSGGCPCAMKGLSNVAINTPGAGCLFGDATETPTTGETIVPVTTMTLASTDYGRLRIATDAANSVFTGSLPFQGQSFGYDNWGAWFFGESALSAIRGKDIRAARVTIARSDAWGSDGAADIRIYAHGWASRPSTATTFSRVALDNLFSAPIATVSLARGQTATAALPDEVLAGLSDGSVQGFAVARQGSYAQLEGSCTLTIEIGE